MRRIACPIVLALMPPCGAVAAPSYENCEKVEIAAIAEALVAAEKLSLRAAVAVSDTEVFVRWFGPWDKEKGRVVRAGLKSIHQALRDDTVKVVCANIREADCTGETFATVAPHDAYVVNVCPAFFDMPEMHVHAAGSAALENGTRAGTIIHEMSHFRATAATLDICYSRPVCEGMARAGRADMARNADSYQYFAEDVSAER